MLFWTPPMEFLIFLLNPWKFQVKQSSIPGNSTKNCGRSLGNFKTRNQDPWMLHTIFSWSSFLEIPLCFYLTPRNSTYYFFDTPRNSISSASPLSCLVFGYTFYANMRSISFFFGSHIIPGALSTGVLSKSKQFLKNIQCQWKIPDLSMFFFCCSETHYNTNHLNMK